MQTGLTAFEHEVLAIGTGLAGPHLTPEEAERLCDLNDALPGLCSRSYHSIKLAQYCGLVNLGGRLLEILPKVGERRLQSESQQVLLRLLRNSSELPIRRDAPVGHSVQVVPLLEIFIEMFFDEIAQIIRQGLLRRYQEEEGDLVCVRGTIVLHRQFSALANRRDRVACHYDELTADNVWNRAAKVGLRLVYRSIRSLPLQRRWVELMAAFAEVEDIAPAALQLGSIVYDRQVLRYRPVVQWVELFRSLLSPELRGGRRQIPGLLLDMNRLFEKAVETRVDRLAAGAGWSLDPQASQHRRHLGASVEAPPRAAFEVRPDLLFLHRGTIVAIADAKWKRPERDRCGMIVPDRADIYQLLSYAAVYACKRLALIYPAQGDELFSAFDLPSLANGRPRITVLAMRVTCDELFVSGWDRWTDERLTN